jgi:adenylate cyclase
VNLAARISALAGGGEVLLSEATRQAAGAVAGVRFEDRGSRRVRNVSRPVHLFAAVAEGSSGRATVIDPVCRMVVEPSRAVGVLSHRGVEYRFCSLWCAQRFAAAPADYAGDAQATESGAEPSAGPPA